MGPAGMFRIKHSKSQQTMKRNNTISIDAFLAFLLRYEGGIMSDKYCSLQEAFCTERKKAFANDPADRGGATLCGITLTTYKRYLTEFYGRADADRATPLELRQISYFDWKNIVCRYYWDALRCGEMVWPGVALCVADFGFNSGTDRAARMLQQLLNTLAAQMGMPFEPLAVDGLVGPATIGFIRKWISTRTRANVLCEMLCDQRAQFVERAVALGAINAKFGKGLNNRIRALRYLALQA